MLNKGKADDATIKELKGRFPGQLLFRWPSSNGKDEAICRAITSDDKARIDELVREGGNRPTIVTEVNEKIFDMCCLWPKLSVDERFSLPIGVIPSIVKVIQEKSGYIDVDVLGRALRGAKNVTVFQKPTTWPDITDDEAKALKEEFSMFPAYKVYLDTYIFVVRPMTRADMRLAEQGDDAELTLAKSQTIWPKSINWDTIPAGIVEQLGDTANRLSGWDTGSIVEEL